MYIAAHAKVGWVNDLVRGRIVQYGFGVDASFVGEGTEAGDGVVEGDVDFHGCRDEVFNVFEFLEIVFRHYVVSVDGNHASHETTQRGDAVALLQLLSAIGV